MLFADFAGYSRLHDANTAHFQADFWAILARRIESSAVKPLFANTWGDGLYLVFASPFDAASFALRVVDDFRAVDWTAVGLPETRQIRIALHTGPVFCGFDPIIGRDNYFGLQRDPGRAHRADHAARHRLRQRGVRRHARRLRPAGLRARSTSARWRSPRAAASRASTGWRRAECRRRAGLSLEVEQHA